MNEDKIKALTDNSAGKRKISINSINDFESSINNKSDRFIKLFINILNWEWYSDINVKILFIHCLLKANYKPSKWKGINIKPGEFPTSLNSLSQETGLTLEQVRYALRKLKKTNEITCKTTHHYSIIIVNNWNIYQTNSQTNSQTIHEQFTTLIEYNNNNKNNKNKIPTVEQIEEYCIEKNYNVDAQKFYDYYAANNWQDSKGKPVLNWKLKLIYWANNNQNTFNKGGEEVATATTWNPNV